MPTQNKNFTLEKISENLPDTLTVRAIANFLGISDQSVRKNISNGKLKATKPDKNLSITMKDFSTFLDENYSSAELIKLHESITFPKSIISSTANSLDTLFEQMINNVILENLPNTITAIANLLNNNSGSNGNNGGNIIDPPLYVLPLQSIMYNITRLAQPTCTKIISILEKTLCVGTHPNLQVGQTITTPTLTELFNRQPSEGINFCESSGQLYCITKVGSDNPLNTTACYSDIFIDGKIRYEGRGSSTDQTMNGSNLHLQRRLDMFNKTLELSPDNTIDNFIHVFNKILLFFLVVRMNYYFEIRDLFWKIIFHCC